MPKAVVCRELGPPESLRMETLSSAARAGSSRIAIHAAGINFPGYFDGGGPNIKLKPALPFTPGMEAAGDVVELNEGVGIAVRQGHRQAAARRLRDEVVVSPSQLAPLPATFDYAEGATFLAGHGTAYHALMDRGQIQDGRSAAGARRRRWRWTRRGRDRQGARRHCDRGRLERGKTCDRQGEGSGSSRAVMRANRSATPSNVSPTGAVRMSCSILSAARCLRTACAVSIGARGS